MTAEKLEDLTAILPENEGIVVVDGIRARVKRLKSREFLSLIRVLTIGLGPNVGQFKFEGDEDEVKGQVLAMFLMAIPEAIDEFGEFLFKIVEPVDKSEAGQLSKAMQNPDVDVLLDVLTLVATQEVNDFRSLVGKGKAALMKIQSVYRPTGS
jgi:hypothetical protein